MLNRRTLLYPSNLKNWFLAAPSSSLYGHRFKRCPFDPLHRPCVSTWPASMIKKLKRWDCQIPNFLSYLGIFSSFFLWTTAFCQEETPHVPVSQTPDGRVNYPSNFQVEGGINLFLFGEYLYWIAGEDSLYYAHTGRGSGTTVVPPNGEINFKGRLKKVKPEWDSGLRLGIGFNFPKEGYDAAFYWTWFSTDRSNSVSNPEGTLFSIWAHPDNTATVADTFAKGSWNLNFNLLDLEWGRSSWFGGYFSLRPFFGVRELWLRQDLKNRYDYDTTPITFGKLGAKSDFSGGGLRAGADARFAIPYGFSIYGIASGSLLYGRFNADFRLKENSFTIAQAKNHFWRGISSLQLALGLGWDTHFFRDRLHIQFHIGWEQNEWFSVNQMSHYMQEVGSGVFFQENSNLSLQGLVAGGRFDF